MELIVKSNALLQLVSDNASVTKEQPDELRMLEMSLNKNDILLDKSKLVILRLRKLYIVIPFSMAKIEVRTRNVMINQRKKMEGIERFAEFYLAQIVNLGVPKPQQPTE
jgi:hypothetical protein